MISVNKNKCCTFQCKHMVIYCTLNEYIYAKRLLINCCWIITVFTIWCLYSVICWKRCKSAYFISLSLTFQNKSYLFIIKVLQYASRVHFCFLVNTGYTINCNVDIFLSFFMFHRRKSQVCNHVNHIIFIFEMMPLTWDHLGRLLTSPLHLPLTVRDSVSWSWQWLLSCHLIWQLQETISVLQCSEI